ncbi:DUF4349 domain-containing protein [Methylobacterium sp. 88A]|uniref:DUF4349 domain-containing protein n=1 Tax=Methylobacterium sp. 88A TaxID=1131813 RepID=UPI00039FD934|nr:DUF4349 domain-containing protein [Methylobacterium sp. 88A]
MARLSPVARPLAQTGDAKLAYTHELTIGLPPQRVNAHFEAARDRCLNEAARKCVLVAASIDDGRRPAGRPQAQVQVRLPHESVAPFMAFVTSPLPGEATGDVVLRSQSTRADDLTDAIEDGGRRLAQLTAYRARLDAIAARPDPRVEDLIRIAQELAQVQSQIEEADAKQRGLSQRVDTELVSVAMRSDEARAGTLAPVEEAWDQAGQTFGASAGSALRFFVAGLPWLPLVLIGVLLLRALWRRRGRRSAMTERTSSRAQP